MNSRALLRRQLDARVHDLPRHEPPTGGWIRAVRQALGMTMAQLGARLGVTAPAIADLEGREATGTISIAKLRSAAEAMECELLIAFVPRQPLTEMVRRQATLKAAQEENRLRHTMALEDQAQGVGAATDSSTSIDRWMTKSGARLWD